MHDKIDREAPLVSVLVMAYNKGPYIRNTLESILMQETTFPYEVVVAEDCSTDDTLFICRELQNTHPDIIRVLVNETNLGYTKNYMRAYDACRGKYIADCDGDDYWIDSDKLEKQVSFLESSPDHSMSGHESLSERDGVILDSEKWNAGKGMKSLSSHGFIARGHFRTSTLVYRRECLHFLPEFETALVNDLYVKLFLATRGKVAFFAKPMSVKMIHDTGVSKLYRRKTLATIQNTFKVINALDRYTGGVHHDAFQIRQMVVASQRFKHDIPLSLKARILAFAVNHVDRPVRLQLLRRFASSLVPRMRQLQGSR